MIPKKWMAVIGTIMLVFLLGTGFFVLAADYGTEADPLVSLSYINDVLAPAIDKEMDAAIAGKTAEFEKILADKIKEMTSDTDSLVNMTENNYKTMLDDDEFLGHLATALAEKMTASGGSSATFKQVTIPKGKTMYLTMGCEVLLRLGTGTLVASGNPGLVDMTTGGTLGNNAKLAANHLYLVTVETNSTTKRGISAASGDVTVMVLGSYTIS
ncbi:MAG: hypothetical protein IKL89_00345 [Clostridia bacterium]|nr:hypothetical protein [Clostridia bacterium]